MQSHLILDNFGIVCFLVFGRMPVDLSHFSSHFDSILSPKYFILKVLKCSFNTNAWTSVNKAETPEVVGHPVLPQALVQKSIHNLFTISKIYFLPQNFLATQTVEKIKTIQENLRQMYHIIHIDPTRNRVWSMA